MEKIVGRFIIQIAGKPVENVTKALNVVLRKLKDEKDKFKVLESEIMEPELDEETTLYSGFLEVELKFTEMSEVLNFIMDYTPNSVEIIEPTELELDNFAFTGILNDFSAHLLKSNTEVRNLRAYVHVLNGKIEELKTSKK